MFKKFLLGMICMGLNLGALEAKETIKVFTRAPAPKNAVTPLIGFRGNLLIANNCLYFGLANKTKVLAVWPYGTTVQGKRVVIPRKNGKQTLISEGVLFNGSGFVMKPNSAEIKNYASCLTKGQMMVQIL